MPTIDFGMVLTIALGVVAGLILFNAIVVVFTLCAEWVRGSKLAENVFVWVVVIALFVGASLLVNRFFPDIGDNPSTKVNSAGASGSSGGDWFAQHAPNASEKQ
ncbi:MAG TPA: hypothetical protein VHC90_03120 [Bryobacteraceae bacterium]|nr:hypothetical protein [Bryobacteraceae bacterium]